MKKRLLALTLAAAMLFTSVNVAVADESAAVDNETVIEEVAASEDSTEAEDAEVEPVDSVESGSAAVTLDDDAEEDSEWVFGGQGSPGEVDADGYGYPVKLGVVSSFTGDLSDFTIVANDVDGNDGVGKLYNQEDSYTYYMTKIPADEDYTLTAQMQVTFHPNANVKDPLQTGAGFVMTQDVIAGIDYPTKFNSVMVTPFCSSNTSSTASTSLRTTLDKTSTITTMIADDTPVGGTGPLYDLKIKKMGNTVRVYVTDQDGNVYRQNADVTDLFAEDVENDDGVYVGFFVARNGIIHVTDTELSVGTRAVSSLTIASMPDTVDYYTNQSFDSTGLAFDVVYADGTSETITDPDDYNLTGFDDNTAYTFETIGTKTITATIGDASVTFELNISSILIEKAEIKYSPAATDYFVGNKFDPLGLEVNYTFQDGSVVTLEGDDNKITINGTVMTSSSYITEDMVGDDVEVKVEYYDDENTDKNGTYATYYIDVQLGTFVGLSIGTLPTKTVYYIGEEADYAGLSVQAEYKDSNNVSNFRYIDEDEYEVSGLDTSAVNDSLTLTITYLKDTSKTVTFTVKVKEDKGVRIEFITHPRYTYAVGEKFDPSGLDAEVLYTSNTYKKLCADNVYYLYDGNSYTKVTIDGAAETTESATADEALNADYYIDLTNFNNTVVGSDSSITLVPKDKTYVADSNTKTITIVESTDYIWKAGLLGQSAAGASGVGTSYIYLTTTDGEVYTSDRYAHEIEPQAMIDGQLENVESVRLNSWDGCGKVSGDQDGIAYYYTRVSNANNFKISADIHVNRYIREPDLLTKQEDIDNYNNYYQLALAAGYSESEAKDIALDRLRSGQECFGIMAKDVIPYAGGINSDGEYTGNLNNHRTTVLEDALTSDFTYVNGSGETVTVETPVDIYEAYTHNLTCTDNDGVTYQVTYADLDNTFASNIVIAGACTDSTYPTEASANSSTYYKKTQMNRINIMIRRGVSAPDGGGERVGILSTTDHLPKAGDDYTITLEKINGGYMITTTDHTTGTTNTKKDFLDELEAENVLGIQDNDNIYVGFFASRYADCTVTNISLYETDPDTDPTYTNDEDEEVSPKITVTSPLYVTYDNYSLGFKANNDSGGYVTISHNGKAIFTDIGVGKKATYKDVQLVKDSINQFTIVYTPSTADNLTSYDPVVYRFNVTHKSMDSTDLIYAGPDGTVAGDGTREDPVDIETAVGIVGIGGTVILLDGEYHIQDTEAQVIDIPSSSSGIQGKPKTIMAEEGANPVLDLEDLYNGFSVDADYWTFDGLTIANAGGNMKAFTLAGQYDVIKNCTFRDNGETGFQMSRINSSDGTIDTWPSYNLVQSCESFNNCDPSKNNADGFAAKLTVGYGNVFSDCISHHNLDDGWDCYTKLSTGVIGASSLENCISYRQGYKLLDDGTDQDYAATSGGNGFKLGGENIYVKHYVKDCIAFNNKANGVESNFNPTIKIRNIINYNNEDANLYLHSGSGNVLTDADGNTKDSQGRSYKFDYDLAGCVSVGDVIDLIGSYNEEVITTVDGVETRSYVDDTTYGNISELPIVSESNYIKHDLDSKTVNSNGEEIDLDTFFVSTNQSDSLGDDYRYTRNSDGSFNHGTFLQRTEEYVHDAADEITYPSQYSGAETITSSGSSSSGSSSSSSSSSGGGGGGGGGSIKTTTTTTEATTTAATSSTTTTKPVITKDVIVTIGSNVITIGTDDYTVDAAPYIQAESNSTLVPLRVVSLAITGGDVVNADSAENITWNNETKTATISAADKVVQFTAGSEIMVVDGKTMVMDNSVKAEIKDSRMYVPFRALGKALGIDVEWDADARAAKYVAPTTEATTEETTEAASEEASEETTAEVVTDEDGNVVTTETTTEAASETTTAAVEEEA